VLKKTFLLNLILQIALNLCIKPLYILGVERAVQNTVGEYQYGFYFSLLNFSLLFQIINDFGIQNFVSKTIAEKPSQANVYFMPLVIFKAILAVVYVVCSLVFAVAIGYTTPQIILLLILLFVQILSSYFLFLRAIVAALGFFKQDSWLSIFDRLGLVLFCAFLFFYQYITSENGIWWLAVAQVFSMSLACGVGIFFVRQKIDFQSIRLDKNIFKNIFLESLPFALITFFMTIYTRSDAVLLERLADNGAVQTGLYAAAYRLLDALNAVTLIFGSLLLPMFTKLRSVGERTEPLLRLSLTLVSFMSIGATGLIFTHRTAITTLLYKHADERLPNLLAILILSYVPLAMMYVLGALSTAKGDLRPMQYVFGWAAVFNFSSHFLLIPTYGAFGAACTTLCTQLLVVIGLGYINDLHKQVAKGWQIILFGLLHAFTLYFLQRTTLQWTTQGIIAGLLLPLWAMLLTWKMLTSIRKS
jgi:O-antigen/teichoic acid export membrane protein